MATQTSIRTMGIWAQRFDLELKDTDKAEAALDTLFPGSEYMGPLALVIHRHLALTAPEMTTGVRKGVAIMAACAVSAVRNNTTNGETDLYKIACTEVARRMGDDPNLAEFQALMDDNRRQVVETAALAVSLRARSHSRAAGIGSEQSTRIH